MQYNIETENECLRVTVTGPWSMREFRPMVEAIRDGCQRSELRRALVDARSVTDEVSPIDRFEAGKQVASVLLGIRIVLVFDPCRITRLAENTAVNRGADMAIFGEPAEALAWLHGDARSTGP